ncbi:MAG: hypothetical protein M1352_00180 [Patescibacteria group bacterium]|nr:hypothetical protein [Patescibacteria group bacterium]
MKKLLTLTITVLLLGCVISGGVYAAGLDVPGLVRGVDRLANQATRAAERKAQGLETLIQRADKMIGMRISSLNTINTRIQNDNRLTSDQKNSLTNEVQNDIAGLTALKQKIDADTDLVAARANAKEIVTNYYIYAVFEPKIRLLITLNNLAAVDANLAAQLPEIQNLVNDLKSQGKDTTGLQSYLSDISQELKTISVDINSNIAKVEALGNGNVSEAEQIFSTVRQDIANTTRAGFAKIRADFGQMRNLFKQLIAGSRSSTPSASTD